MTAPRSFAEMAAPGTVFEGNWQEKTFFTAAGGAPAVRWPEGFGRARIFEAANDYAARLLAIQKQYAGWAGLDLLERQIEELEARLAEARAGRRVPALARLGRRPAGQERLAGYRQPRLPRDPRSTSLYGKALWRRTCRSPRRAASSS